MFFGVLFFANSILADSIGIIDTKGGSPIIISPFSESYLRGEVKLGTDISGIKTDDKSLVLIWQASFQKDSDKIFDIGKVECEKGSKECFTSFDSKSLKDGPYQMWVAVSDSTNKSKPINIIIDNTAPTATIAYSITIPTNHDVTATITPNEEVKITSEGGLSHLFKKNGSFIFEFADLTGNVGVVTATVSNIDTVAPVITLLGDSSMTLSYGSSFIDPGAITDDGSSIVPTGSVDTNTAGTYVITYNSTDLAGNSATEVSRTVTVNNRPNGGHGGGGGGNSSINSITPVVTAPAGQVLGAEKFLFLNNMKTGSKLDPDVKELQNRLTTEGFFKVTANGYFGPATKAAVKAYQKANSPLKVDGTVGPLTRALLNK